MNATTQNGRMQNGMQPYRLTQAVPATILLVEDEPAVRMVTREALELGGYRVPGSRRAGGGRAHCG